MHTHYNPLLKPLLLTALAVSICGCAGTGVQRVSLDRERPITTNFDPDDLRQTADTLVDSMLAFPTVTRLVGKQRPPLSVLRIENATMQQIDTKNITDSVRTRLVRSGLFRVKDPDTSNLDKEIMHNENSGGLTDPAQAAKPGKQFGTKYTLYGRITQMEAKRGRVKDVYYKITMTLKDLQSGELIWTDEKEIRKESRRPSVGW